MSNTNICRGCGKEIEDGALYCVECTVEESIKELEMQTEM